MYKLLEGAGDLVSKGVDRLLKGLLKEIYRVP